MAEVSRERLEGLAAGVAPEATRPAAPEYPSDPHTGWTCRQCYSDRWVSSSFDGGITRRYQCVPCGAVGGFIQ